jgi:hypothetical protein
VRLPTPADFGKLISEENREAGDRVNREFGVEAAFDVGGLPETVLLARQQQIADGISIGPQRLDRNLGLVRRHHRVLQVAKVTTIM